jgi:cell division initiation protein
MITPQEVAEHAFTKAAFGGYNMQQVDEFLDVLTADYTALYKENAVLKSKMKVLVDKVEEYRATEDAMRMTLLSAQKMANAMVAEAEEKKNAALKDAEADVRHRILKIRQDVETEEFRLTAARTATAEYLAKLRELFDREQEYLGSLSELTPPGQKPPDPVESAAAEIEDSVSKLISEEAPPAPEEPEDLEDTKELDAGALSAAADAEKAPRASSFQVISLTLNGEEKAVRKEDAPDSRRINFDNLQFGKDYEIK